MDAGEDDYIIKFPKLNAHLDEVRPIFDAFCARHSFVPVVGARIGRYPRIQIERAREVTLWIDLWMTTRPEVFHPDLVYELTAGGAALEPDDPEWNLRYLLADHSLRARFRDLVPILAGALERLLVEIEPWSATFLRTHGQRSPSFTASRAGKMTGFYKSRGAR